LPAHGIGLRTGRGRQQLKFRKSIHAVGLDRLRSPGIDPAQREMREGLRKIT
jgi:hypothetical protein